MTPAARSPADSIDALDPRVARSRAAVLEAALELLAEQGWSGATVAGIATRSGVAKTTIYRHWSSLTAIILDALRSLAREREPEVTSDLYADLVTMTCALADDLEQARWSHCLPALVEAGERDPEVAAVTDDLTRQALRPLSDRLDRAVREGHLPADTDVLQVTHMLADPLFHRRLITRERSPTRFIEGLVDRALLAFRG